MSEVSDADRAKAAELLRGMSYPGILDRKGQIRYIAAALADARAEADQLRDAMRALAEEWEADSRDAMKRSDAAREAGVRELYTANVRHARVAIRAATRVRDLADGGRR